VPNPTHVKQSNGVYSSALALGANCQCLLDFNQPGGAPIYLVNRIAGRRSAGLGFPKNFGPSPAWVTNGLGTSWTLKFVPGSPSVSFDDAPRRLDVGPGRLGRGTQERPGVHSHGDRGNE
jgi:hypothetical protein